MTVSWLKTWLNTCTRDHELYQSGLSGHPTKNEPVLLPSRVIAVGDKYQQPCLIETQGSKGLYTVLSHCWGPPGKQPLSTTKSNLASRTQGIPWNELPKTFQDTIMVTSSVGIPYIWIDSLCIVQDDAEDWQREASGMEDVHEKSHLKIAATAATDSTRDLFLPRPEVDSVRIPYMDRVGTELGHIYIYEPLSRTLPTAQ